MSAIQRIVLSLSSLFAFLTVHALAQNLEMKNSVTVVEFGPMGLGSIKDVESGIQVDLARDAWSLALDNRTLRSEDGRPKIKKTATGDGAECVVKAQQAHLSRRSFLNLMRNSRTLRSGSQVIAMMQSTEPRYGDDCTARVCFLCVAARRSLLIQPKVSAIFVIVADVLIHQTLRMPLVQDDHTIEQITATVTDPALGNTVLPRASETGPLGLVPRQNSIR